MYQNAMIKAVNSAIINMFDVSNVLALLRTL